MAIMMGALYDALVETKVSEPTARRAAEEMAQLEMRLMKIEHELTTIRWMIGTLVVLFAGHLWLSFNILSRLAR